MMFQPGLPDDVLSSDNGNRIDGIPTSQKLSDDKFLPISVMNDQKPDTLWLKFKGFQT